MGLGHRAAAFGVRRPGANPGAHHPRGEVGSEFGLEVRTCPSAEAEGLPGAHTGVRLPPPSTLRTVALCAPDLAWRHHKGPPWPCHPRSRRDPSPAATNPHRHFATCWILRTTLQVRSCPFRARKSSHEDLESHTRVPGAATGGTGI